MRSGRFISALIEGGEVRRKVKINMVDQKLRKITEQIKRDLLELWRKRALSDELYKAKEKIELEIWR